MHHRKLGRYELARVLGKGAMGVVYEARDPNLDRRVAIKTIMVDDLAPGAAAEYEERFRTEARSAARLQHPNIVTVYDSDRDGNTAFLVMEFIEGDDLKRHLDRGDRHDVQQALHLITDLLAALDFAHRQGVVHRDVKPANLLIEPGGRLKLTDFGVARIAGEATRTQGSMIGTLKYMAPEQVQGQKIDSRADLFSAAVVAYQLVTGVRPFDGDNDFSIIQQVIGHTPPAPSTLKPGLPQSVDAVFARALSKNRNERFQSGLEFSSALQAALDGVVLPAGSTTVPGMHPVWRSDTIPGAGIDQELELEYWRAVRDSADLRELEGFLTRFPAGVYADLARRRLQRLSTDPDTDATVLQGRTRMPAPPVPIEHDPDATRTEPLAVAPRKPPAVATTASGAQIVTKRVVQDDDEDDDLPPLARKRHPWWALGGLGAVALVALVVLWGVLRPGAPAAAPDAAAASAAPVVAKAAERSPPPVSAPTIPAINPSQEAGVLAPGAQPVASRAPDTKAAKASGGPTKVASAAGTRRSTGTGSQVVAQGPSGDAAAQRDATQEHGMNGLVPPAVTCKDKVFLAKQYCVYNECQKPGYQNFPSCVRLREDAKLRESSRYGN